MRGRISETSEFCRRNIELLQVVAPEKIRAVEKTMQQDGRDVMLPRKTRDQILTAGLLSSFVSSVFLVADTFVCGSATTGKESAVKFGTERRRCRQKSCFVNLL